MSDTQVNEVTINGVRYVRADISPASGTRAVVVVDRGWIFAGDVDDETIDGFIRLTRAVWVFRWEGVGFAAVIANPKQKSDIRPIADVEIPKHSEIFRIPVGDTWGL